MSILYKKLYIFCAKEPESSYDRKNNLINRIYDNIVTLNDLDKNAKYKNNTKKIRKSIEDDKSMKNLEDKLTETEEYIDSFKKPMMTKDSIIENILDNIVILNDLVKKIPLGNQKNEYKKIIKDSQESIELKDMMPINHFRGRLDITKELIKLIKNQIKEKDKEQQNNKNSEYQDVKKEKENREKKMSSVMSDENKKTAINNFNNIKNQIKQLETLKNDLTQSESALLNKKKDRIRDTINNRIKLTKNQINELQDKIKQEQLELTLFIARKENSDNDRFADFIDRFNENDSKNVDGTKTLINAFKTAIKIENPILVELIEDIIKDSPKVKDRESLNQSVESLKKSVEERNGDDITKYENDVRSALDGKTFSYEGSQEFNRGKQK